MRTLSKVALPVRAQSAARQRELGQRAEQSELLKFPISLARLMHPAAMRGNLDPITLGGIAEGLARSVGEFRVELEGHGQRSYRRLVSTGYLEAWLIAWHPGAFLDLHDHGGSSGAFTIISGELVEICSDIILRRPLQTTHLSSGSSRHFAPTHVHEIWNASQDTALSVHVYSPPLSTMSFYSHRQQNYLERLRTEVDCVGPD